MPARPRWLLALPDAIAQLDALDRPLVTRRDLESLFGVSRARAATLMRAFGAEWTGSIRTLPRPALLRQLRQIQQSGTVRTEAARQDRVLTVLRQARRTGIVKAIWAVSGGGVAGASQPCGRFTEENTPGWRQSTYLFPQLMVGEAVF